MQAFEQLEKEKEKNLYENENELCSSIGTIAGIFKSEYMKKYIYIYFIKSYFIYLLMLAHCSFPTVGQ